MKLAATLPALGLLLTLCALSASPATAMVGPNNYWAAQCCSRGTACDPNMARKSLWCRPRVWMADQSSNCRTAACMYCNKDSARSQLRMCNTPAIVRNCFRGVSPGNNNKPKPPMPAPRPSAGCAYRARNGRLYVPAVQFPFNWPWVRFGNKIVWKPNGGSGIDRPNSGRACVSFVPDYSGRYYLTAITAAPHVSEHNDMWVSTDAGMSMYRHDRRSFVPNLTKNDVSDMRKGYHPKAGNTETDELFNKDFDPHQFLTKPVVAGRRYQVCIAGRSTRFSVFAVVMVHCSSIQGCAYYNDYVRRRTLNKTPSKCY